MLTKKHYYKQKSTGVQKSNLGYVRWSATINTRHHIQSQSPKKLYKLPVILKKFFYLPHLPKSNVDFFLDKTSPKIGVHARIKYELKIRLAALASTSWQKGQMQCHQHHKIARSTFLS